MESDKLEFDKLVWQAIHDAADDTWNNPGDELGIPTPANVKGFSLQGASIRFELVDGDTKKIPVFCMCRNKELAAYIRKVMRSGLATASPASNTTPFAESAHP